MTEVPRDVADGIADLRDFCTDPDRRTTTPVAGEAISGLYRLFYLGESDKVRQAYAALHRLRERDGETPGRDVPANHATVYKKFRDVIDHLIYAVERDHDKELKRQGISR